MSRRAGHRTRVLRGDGDISIRREGLRLYQQEEMLPCCEDKDGLLGARPLHGESDGWMRRVYWNERLIYDKF